MRALIPILPMLLTLVLAAGPAMADAWDDAYDKAAKQRFIPIELWTGGDWNGARDLAMPPADLKFGDRLDKEISGPKPWADPINAKTYQVYQRLNKGKVQLFTLRADKIGLGRVFDSRGSRVCQPGFKFPLGLWKEGESRTVELDCWKKDGTKYRRVMTITIEEIDFVHAGRAHSLRYHWVADGGNGSGLNNAYTYSPGRGNVRIEAR